MTHQDLVKCLGKKNAFLDVVAQGPNEPYAFWLKGTPWLHSEERIPSHVVQAAMRRGLLPGLDLSKNPEGVRYTLPI